MKLRAEPCESDEQFRFRLEIALVFVLSELERVLNVNQFRLEAIHVALVRRIELQILTKL
jgi:hypothetical protein